MAIKASEDNAQWISAIEAQGDDEKDWVDEVVKVEYTPKEIEIEDSSTEDELDSKTELHKDDEVRLIDSDNNIHLGKLGDVDYDSDNDIYKADITSFDLDDTPTKAYFNTYFFNRLSIDDTPNPLTVLPIDDSSDKDNLVTTVEVLENDRIIVDNEEMYATDVTVNDDGDKWTIPINKDNTPQKAYKINNTDLEVIPLPQLELDTDDTDEDNLVVYTKIEKDDKITLYEDSDGYVEFQVGDVDSLGNIDDPDPFGDDSGLALFHFEDDATDVSGNYDGTEHNGVSYDDNGFFDKGLLFCDDSENQYISTDEMAGTKSAFTYTAWLNGDTGDDGTYAYIMAEDSSDAVYGFNVKFSNNDNPNKADIYIGGDYKRVDLGITMDPEDKWFVAYWWDKTQNDGKAYLYIKNITKDTDATVDSDDVTCTDDLDKGIGVVVGVPSNYDGRRKMLIDQVRVFNKILSDDERGSIFKKEVYYKTDISSLDLAKAPTNVWWKNPLKNITATSDNEYTIKDDKLIVVDNEEVVCDSIDVSEVDDKYQYDIVFPTRDDIPQKVAIKDSSTITTTDTETYDSDNNVFKSTSVKLNKSGRNMQYHLIGDTDVVVNKITIDFDKESDDE